MVNIKFTWTSLNDKVILLIFLQVTLSVHGLYFR